MPQQHDGDAARPERALDLDFLIPASPTDGFYSQIALFRLGLDRLGGVYRQARLVAVFGDESRRPLPQRWRPFFDRIEVAWVDPAAFRQHGYLAQSLGRFDLLRPDADLAVFCDADTVLMRGLGRLVAQLIMRPALAGVIAHYDPWRRPGRSGSWQSLALDILGREVALPYFYAFEAETADNRCPFYINAGFIAAPPRLWTAVHRRFLDLFAEIARRDGTYFAAQLTVPLVVEDLSLPCLALPMRYNFPNDPVAEQRYPAEKHLIVLLHYLRTTAFDRQRIFASRPEFDAFLSQPLGGSNRILQQFIGDLTGGAYPFAEEPTPNIAADHAAAAIEAGRRDHKSGRHA